jgi:hypothetical protein
MAQLNSARDAIRSRENATPPISSVDEFLRNALSDAASYDGPYCTICGHGPVALVEYTVQVGKLFVRSIRKTKAPLCRHCGEALYRDAQNQTLLKGWWGVLSFFANFFYLLDNLSQHGNLRSLTAPTPTPKSAITPSSRPLPVGPPLASRAGVWVATALLVAVASIAYGDWKSSQPTSAGTSFTPISVPVPTYAGVAPLPALRSSTPLVVPSSTVNFQACAAWHRALAAAGDKTLTNAVAQLPIDLGMRAEDSLLRAASIEEKYTTSNALAQAALDNFDASCRRLGL